VSTGPKSRVLIVEDDPSGRRALSMLVERAGHAVEAVEDGRGALARLALTPLPDLVLLDLHLPDLDGSEILTRMHTDAVQREIPVLVISGAEDASLVSRCIEMGADDFLPKPFDRTLLAARMRSSLAKKRVRDLERERVLWLEREESKSRRLLTHVLPQSVAERLREGETVAAHHDDVTVLFADLVRFTDLTNRLSATELLDLLNRIFSKFDELAAARGVEKIKTIGDAYLAVGGLPEPLEDHVARVVDLGIAMIEALPKITAEPVSLRIGIHTGPVVAGVIGTDKLQYDLWGATVNLASRMESSGAPGLVQVTRSVYERVSDRFAFESSAVVHAKGFGDVDTWRIAPLTPTEEAPASAEREARPTRPSRVASE
jgi:adenylate cyclase